MAAKAARPERAAAAACAPGQPCWPTPAQWASFNASIDGALISVVPILAPCFGSFPGVPASAADCSAIVSNFSNSFMRAATPGALQNINWEQDPATLDDCLEAAKPCRLGGLPPFAVAAASAAHVAAALAFARAHSMRVVVRSTGHEYQGRSTGANALLIWTHALRGARFDAAFSACPAAAAAPAVTTSPGTAWGEVYALASSHRVTVVGGSEISVSSCGGYTLGGGHSWMGPAFGMAADNALRFELVLANGSAVRASACENADLFWALRGGGGGTFGVLVSCTYAAHPYPAGGAAGLFGTVGLPQGPASLALLLDGFFAFAHTLSDANASASGVVAGGYVIPDLGAAPPHVSFLLGFNGTVDQANAALAPFGAWLQAQAAALPILGSQVLPFPSLMQFHEYWDNSSEATGGVVALGSRLLPAAAFLDDAARLRLAVNLTQIAYAVGGFTGMFVCGGQVAAGGVRDASFTPAWRAAGFHVAFGAGWAVNATREEQDEVLGGVSALAGWLRDDTPGSGAYWSEADFLEPAWQDAFWGPNYPRLQAVKKAVDPAGVFACHHCVELP